MDVSAEQYIVSARVSEYSHALTYKHYVLADRIRGQHAFFVNKLLLPRIFLGSNLLTFLPMKADQPIRILIVDDNMLILSATKMVLSTFKEFHVVGEATDGINGIRMALELEPDIVLMDINMKPVDGIRATRILLSKRPQTLVIGFSALPHPNQEREIIRAGAQGVIHKSATREVIGQSLLRFHRQNADFRTSTRDAASDE